MSVVNKNLIALNPAELLEVKHYYHKLQASLRREYDEAPNPSRLQRVAQLLRRVDYRLQDIYKEFERRTREKQWPPATLEAYGSNGVEY